MKLQRLIIPIFSMRSYETSQYSILKDGNFQLHLNRMHPNDLICIPNNTCQKDLDKLYELNLVNEANIIRADYGFNAVDSRRNFWKTNKVLLNIIIEQFNIDLVITDITGCNLNINIINNFNITKNPDIQRSYIDEFIDIDVQSVNNKLSLSTFVLNESQKEYLVKCGADANKIVVSKRVINHYYYNKFNLIAKKLKIGNVKPIFFPFRLSDKCYDFFGTIKKYPNKKFIITDPNDVFAYEADNIYNISTNIFKINIDKEQYYNILLAQPTIIYNENPEEVFHPGLAEFIYFGCNIISDHKMPELEDILIYDDIWYSN